MTNTLLHNDPLDKCIINDTYDTHLSTSEERYPKHIMHMIEKSNNVIEMKEKKLIMLKKEIQDTIDLIELFHSNPRAFVAKFCDDGIKRHVLKNECHGSIKDAKDIYPFMESADNQVRTLEKEIEKLNRKKEIKQKEINTLNDKWNSFFYKKEIQTLEHEIQKIRDEIKQKNIEMEKQAKDAEKIRIISRAQSKHMIFISNNNKESFKQSCDNLYHIIEENILKEYAGAHEYLSEDFIYNQIIDSLSFHGSTNLTTTLIKQLTKEFNEFIEIKTRGYNPNFDEQPFLGHDTVYATNQNLSPEMIDIYDYIKKKIKEYKEDLGRYEGLSEINEEEAVVYRYNQGIDNQFMQDKLVHSGNFRNFKEILSDNAIISASILDNENDKAYKQSRTQQRTIHRDIYFIKNGVDIEYGESIENKKKGLQNIHNNIFFVNTLGNFGVKGYGIPLTPKDQPNGEYREYGYSIVSNDYEEKDGSSICLDDLFIYISEEKYKEGEAICLQQKKSQSWIQKHLIMIPKSVYEDKDNLKNSIWNFINEDTKKRIEDNDISDFKVYDKAKKEKIESISGQYNHYFITKSLSNNI